MKINAKKLIIGITLVVIVIVLTVLLAKKSAEPKPVTPDKISSTSSYLLQAKGGNLYFVDEKKLSLIAVDLKSREENKVISLKQPIDNYSVSPDQKLFFVQTSEGDASSNWIYNKQISSIGSARECIVSLVYLGNGVIYNCFSQLYDYDPNYTNTINFAENPSAVGEASPNLNIDPPKKILGEVDDNVYILTNSPGYKSNNVLSYNKKTKKIDKITDIGTVSKAILSKETKSLIYSNEDESNQFYVMNLASKHVKEFDLETDLELGSLSEDEKFLVLPSRRGGNNIFKLDLVTLQSKTFNPQTGSNITSLAIDADGIYFSTSEGIFLLRPV